MELIMPREETCAKKEYCTRPIEGCGTQECPEYKRIVDPRRGCFD